MNNTMDAFTLAYIECALWSSTAYGSVEERKDVKLHGDSHFDKSFQDCGYDRLTKDAEARILQDCTAFQTDNAELLARWYTECGESPERAGHDFWLTRNGHGAGFWDRWSGDTPQGKIGRQLTDKAHEYGECTLWCVRGKVDIL